MEETIVQATQVEELVASIPQSQSVPDIGAYLAETTFSAKHAKGDQINFSRWDDVWLKEGVSFPHERYASVFKFPPTILEHVRQHGRVKGWKQAEPGLIAVDIDRAPKDAPWKDCIEKWLPMALADLRRLVERWEAKGVNRRSYVIFFSGCKGFGVHFLAEGFGREFLAQVKPVGKHQQHEEAVLLALKALCGDVVFDHTMAQTLRLYRLPNSLNKKGNDGKGLYKVPLTVEETMGWKLDDALNAAMGSR